jgi:DNA uptake protein ComE-like DNA-binding protein
MRPGLCVCAASVITFVVGCALQGPRLDVNSASATELQTLRGLGPDDAARIVAARPYISKEDLLQRHVVSPEQYRAIAGELYVGPPGMPDYLRGVPPAGGGP